jgi:hypothetical protein
MKKIIRLTESDLVRLVKRVIAEDATGATPNNGLKAFQLIKAGMSGLGTDEAKVQTGVFTIKNKYKNINTEKRLQGGTKNKTSKKEKYIKKTKTFKKSRN